MSTTAPTPTLSKTHVSDVTHQSNMVATDVTRMSVDTAGAAHIMSLLTDLYSDPNLAVLREYSSNAIDSHKEAGQDRPIEISLPSPLSPTFEVQDFGVGMSADTIRYVYSSYGASTKRNDFNQIGAFGLGCKSALTLTQQFTIVSNKDGKRTVAHILRGDDGVGAVNVLSEKDTDAPNGVKVSIPIPDVRAFNDNVEKFFSTWIPGSVIVDGKEPYSLLSKDFRTALDGLLYYNLDTAYWDSGLSVIVGGITYSVSLDKMRFTNASTRTILGSRIRMFYQIPIGSVDLTPSREELRYSDRTVEYLSQVGESIASVIRDVAEKDVNDAPSRFAAVKRAKAWENTIPKFSTSVKWHGEDLVFNVEAKGVVVSLSWTYGRTETYLSASLSDTERIYLDQYSDKGKTLHYLSAADVTITDRGFATKFRNYVDHTFKDSATSHRLMIIEGDASNIPTSPWITENEYIKKISVADIDAGSKAYIAEKRKSAGPRDKYEVLYTTYEVDTSDNGHPTGLTKSSDIAGSEVTDDMYYLVENEAKWIESILNPRENTDYELKGARAKKALKNLVSDAFDDGDIIVLVNKTKKLEPFLKRSNDVATNAMDVINKTLDGYLDDFNDVEPIILDWLLTLNDRYSDTPRMAKVLLSLVKVSPIPVLDPLITDMVDSLKAAVVLRNKYTALSYVRRQPTMSGASGESGRTQMNQIRSRYIIGQWDYFGFEKLSADQARHMALYLNAVYAEITAQENTTNE